MFLKFVLTLFCASLLVQLGLCRDSSGDHKYCEAVSKLITSNETTEAFSKLIIPIGLCRWEGKKLQLEDMFESFKALRANTSSEVEMMPEISRTFSETLDNIKTFLNDADKYDYVVQMLAMYQLNIEMDYFEDPYLGENMDNMDKIMASLCDKFAYHNIDFDSEPFSTFAKRSSAEFHKFNESHKREERIANDHTLLKMDAEFFVRVALKETMKNYVVPKDKPSIIEMYFGKPPYVV